MKTCKKGLHTYPESEWTCPECRKASRQAYIQTPAFKETERARSKRRRQDPAYIEKEKARMQSTEYKAKDKARKQKPEVKAKLQSPEYKAIRKDKRQTAEYKATLKTYQGTEEYKAKEKVRHGKRSLIAARGDLTAKQIQERYEEFSGLCAYCNCQLTHTNPHDATHYNIEHIIPIEKKGEHTKANIVPSCSGCNGSKLDRNVWAWMQKTGRVVSDKLRAILDALCIPD